MVCFEITSPLLVSKKLELFFRGWALIKVGRVGHGLPKTGQSIESPPPCCSLALFFAAMRAADADGLALCTSVGFLAVLPLTAPAGALGGGAAAFAYLSTLG